MSASLLRRVVITGIGLVSPVGNTPETFFNALLNGQSGIKRLDADFTDQLDVKLAAQASFDGSEYFTKKELAILDRVSQFALYSACEALKDANLDLSSMNLDRMGSFIGTGMGGANSTEEGYDCLFNKKARRLKPFTVLMAMNGAAASQVSMRFKLKGPNITYTTACSSSAVAIGEAYRQIKHGYTDAAFAGGTEALLTFGTIKAWEALRTLAEEDPNDPAASCKPFSLNRTGLVLGEGAAILILEEMVMAKARGAKIYGEITGYGSTNDGDHITQPSIEGQSRAMKAALDDAKLNPNDIGYINAHGTGTLLNDATETAAIKNVFSNFAYQIPVSSTKSMHGHLMGAAGAVEIVATLLALVQKELPPTINLKEPDYACDLDYVPNQKRVLKELNHVMSNSFAFGGTSSVIIISKI